MTRSEKLQGLLDIAPPIEADLELPFSTCRFVALELDDCGNTLEFYFGDTLEEIKKAIENTETHYVENVRIHDLDKDIVFSPVWKISRLMTIEDKFSYTTGYVSI